MARQALLSVSDKRNLVELARELEALGFRLLSTGGTQAHLAAAGVPVTSVSEVTGFPEILDGRVKTLHPRVHAGILADRRLEAHRDALAAHGIDPIELVVVNLYPFAATAARADASFDDVVEMIDIGGPAMVRAAAKNHPSTLVVVDPDDYGTVAAALRSGEVDDATRRRLARKAFAHTASYDAAIADWLTGQEKTDGGHGAIAERATLGLELVLRPRYGENPHQDAGVYRLVGGPGVLGGMEVLQGKELSWNNLLDADAARKLVALFDEPAVAIIKHNNPCGVGIGADLVEAYARALASDPVSAFGSIVAVNRPVDEAFVAAIADLFVEVLVAPGFDGAARDRMAAKKAMRVVACPPYLPAAGAVEYRGIDGGFLAQAPDARDDDPATWTIASRREPTDDERAALRFAWRIARYVKSNAIVLTGAAATLGIGAGQMSRVDSCRLAIAKAQGRAAGAVAASDAFFPFRDGLDVLAEAGVTAVVQPGGSKRDPEVVAAADEHGMTMLFTDVRHFRH